MDLLEKGEDTGQSPAPKIRETAKQESWLTREQRLSSWKGPKNQCGGRKTWTVTDELLEAQWRQVWELTPSPRRDIYLQNLHQFSTVNIR